VAGARRHRHVQIFGEREHLGRHVHRRDRTRSGGRRATTGYFSGTTSHDDRANIELAAIWNVARPSAVRRASGTSRWPLSVRIVDRVLPWKFRMTWWLEAVVWQSSM